MLFSDLFGQSPFAPLQFHMNRVALAVHALVELFSALRDNHTDQLLAVAQSVSSFEHDADLIKHDIRSSLKKNIVLPIDREALFEILTIQDQIADTAEDVAVLVTLYPIQFPAEMVDLFFRFLQENIDTFDRARQVILELNQLIESSFGGKEAEKVRHMVDDVAEREHRVDLTQRDVLKMLFALTPSMNYATFYIWQRIIEKVAALSNVSENLAYRVRMTLELK